MRKKNGFTFPELLVTIGVFSLLAALVLMNLLHAPAQASLQTTTSLIASDLKSQQLRSMLGDTEGSLQPKTYGVYVQGNQYTLFSAPYSSTDPNNFVVQLNPDLTITQNTLPNGQVIFNRVSGEFSGYSPGSNTLVITNTTTSEVKTVTINRYGVVTIN